MKKLTYIIKNLDGTQEQHVGYTFDVSGLQFGCCKEQCTFNSNHRWRITELQSGYIFLLGEWNESRNQCRQRVLDRIHKVGIVQCRKLIKDAVGKSGNSGKCS